MGALDNKVAIVTGGASGMGEATVRRFAKEGAKVIACDIQDELLAEVVASVVSEGGEAVAMHLDVSNESNWEKVVADTLEKYGTIDILISNAGINAPSQNPEDVSLEAFEKVNSINATGVFLGAKHVIPTMKKNRSGSIVNVGSLASIRSSYQCSIAYIASKGSCRMISKQLGTDLAPYGIRVNAIFPGFVYTGMCKGLEIGSDYYNDLCSHIPLGRCGQSEEIAKAALFLASDEASYITSAELVVDGGWSAHT